MLKEMREEAEARGWSGLGTEGSSSMQPGQGSPKYKQWGLEELLDVMAEEADPSLRPGFINVADISRIGRLSGTPSCVKLIAALREEGHSAARCHITVICPFPFPSAATSMFLPIHPPTHPSIYCLGFIV